MSFNRDVIIRNERPEDRRAAEELTRRAFYNIYMPGCVEHYLLHIMREHEDFIPELDLVAELEGRIVGSMVYTRASLQDEEGSIKPVLTFGPICVEPELQRQGIGRMLMESSFDIARELHYEAIVIFGAPANYVCRGFKSCKRYNVADAAGRFPAAMLVKELFPDVFDGRRWTYSDSPVMSIDEALAAEYDEGLPVLEKRWQPSQEEFYILSNAFLD